MNLHYFLFILHLMLPSAGSGCHRHALSENNAAAFGRFKAVGAWSNQNLKPHRNNYFVQAQDLFMF